MVEVFEYTLVFVVSLLVGGFSFYALGSYTSHARSVEEASVFQSILSAASASIRTGTVQPVVAFFDNDTISCVRGRLSMSTSGNDFFSDVAARCSFSLPSLKGTHSLEFRTVSGNLILRLLS